MGRHQRRVEREIHEGLIHEVFDGLPPMLCSLSAHRPAPNGAAHNTEPLAGGSGGVGASSSCTRRRWSRCLLRQAHARSSATFFKHLCMYKPKPRTPHGRCGHTHTL